MTTDRYPSDAGGHPRIIFPDRSMVTAFIDLLRNTVVRITDVDGDATDVMVAGSGVHDETGFTTIRGTEFDADGPTTTDYWVEWESVTSLEVF